MALNKRFFISFRNIVDDYPEIVTYDTEEEMKAALENDNEDNGYYVEVSGSYDYYLKYQNNITDEFIVKYYASDEELTRAIEIAKKYHNIWEIYSYGKVEQSLRNS